VNNPALRIMVEAYLAGAVTCRFFREWHLRMVLNKEQFSFDEEMFLLGIEARYGELLAGVSEDSFKKMLIELLIYKEPIQTGTGPCTFVPVTYLVVA
jgi:hypothetical protein